MRENKGSIIAECNRRTIKITDNKNGTCTASDANKRYGPSNGFDFHFAPYSSIEEMLAEEGTLGMLEWIDKRLFNLSRSIQGRRKLRSKNNRRILRR